MPAVPPARNCAVIGSMYYSKMQGSFNYKISKNRVYLPESKVLCSTRNRDNRRRIEALHAVGQNESLERDRSSDLPSLLNLQHMLHSKNNHFMV